jgi:hypothetical protein
MLALSRASQNWAGDALGLKVNPARSSVRYTNIETVGFQRHAKGEVFTLYRFDGKGRATTLSTILYFDSRARDLQGFGCSGNRIVAPRGQPDRGDPQGGNAMNPAKNTLAIYPSLVLAACRPRS